MGASKNRKKRPSSEYFCEAEIIEIKHICRGSVQDTRGFRVNNPTDNIKMFEFLCDKLGFSYKDYKKFKNIEWQ